MCANTWFMGLEKRKVTFRIDESDAEIEFFL